MFETGSVNNKEKRIKQLIPKIIILMFICNIFSVTIDHGWSLLFCLYFYQISDTWFIYYEIYCTKHSYKKLRT